MDKINKIKKIQKMTALELKKENDWNDRFYVRDSHTPNQKFKLISKPKLRLKINNHETKNIHEFDEANKINLTTINYKTDQKIVIKSLSKNAVNSSKTINSISSYKMLNNLNNELFINEQKYQKILEIWNNLGVNYAYQNIFNSICFSLSNEKRENFFLYEFKKLNLIDNLLKQILKDINNRERIIFELQKICDEKKRNESNENNNINRDNINNNIIDKDKIKGIADILNNLRNISLNIVSNLIYLEKESGHDIALNKYDYSKLLIYPKEYLIKMKNDLDFLLDTDFQKSFEFKKSDPFFLNIPVNNNYKLAELDDKSKEIIDNYEFMLINEIIFQELNPMICTPKSIMSMESVFDFRNDNKISNNYIPIKLNKNKIIKANRGLSRQKLRPINAKNKNLVNGKLSSKASKPKYSQNQKTIIVDKIKNDNSPVTIFSIKKSTNSKIINNTNDGEEAKHLETANEIINGKNPCLYTCIEKSKEGNIPINIIKKNSVKEDDLMIFEQIIEQSLKEKENIDKDVPQNKFKRKLKLHKKSSNNSHQPIKKVSIPKSNENINENINKKKDSNTEKINIENIKIKQSLNSNDYENGGKSKTQINNQINNKKDEKKKEVSIDDLIFQSNKPITFLNDDNKNIRNSEIEFELDSNKKKYNDISIELYCGRFSLINEIYDDYIKEIPKEIKEGFNLKENINEYISGIYPKILIVRNLKVNSKIISIIILSYEPNNLNTILPNKKLISSYTKTLNIISISCIDESLLSTILINSLDFCKEYFYFEQIILKLYYANKNGQFILYENLETAIKTKAGFKWVLMENDGVDRYIKYRFVNSNIIGTTSTSYNNIINLKSVFILSLEENLNFDFNFNYSNLENESISFINDFSIHYLLFEMKGQYSYKIEDKNNEYRKNLLNNYSFSNINKLCWQYIDSKIGNSDTLKNFIDDMNFTNDLVKKINPKIFSNQLFSGAIMNIGGSFRNIIKKKYNGFMYNIIFNEEINVFTLKCTYSDSNIYSEEDKEIKFYLMHTTDENLSIIIYELVGCNGDENKIRKKLTNLFNEYNEKESGGHILGLSEVFSTINVKAVQKPKSKSNKILIPSFKIINDEMIYNPPEYKDINLKDNISEYKINCLNYIEEISFGIEESINMMDFDSKNTNEDLIIENDFFICIVNNDLMYELKIPSLATFLVKKSSWITSS